MQQPKPAARRAQHDRPAHPTGTPPARCAQRGTPNNRVSGRTPTLGSSEDKRRAGGPETHLQRESDEGPALVAWIALAFLAPIVALLLRAACAPLPTD